VAGPAKKVFADDPTNRSKVQFFDNEPRDINRKELKERIINFSPKFILLGLSIEQNTIDLLVREICLELEIGCGVIQDYWGYLGSFSRSLLPDYFFVFDDEATRLSELNSGRRLTCLPFGSPKHEAYKYSITDWKKNKSPFLKGELNLLYIGQPISIAGVFENFLLFVETMFELDLSINIFFKPHPLDVGCLDEYTKKLTALPNFIRILGFDEAIEPALLHADLVITCFSTAGYDHNYLQLFSEEPIGSLVYLLAGKEIINHMENVVGEPIIPSAELGLGNVCTNANDFKLFMKNFSDDNKQLYFNLVKSRLKKYDRSTSLIYDYLKHLE